VKTTGISLRKRGSFRSSSEPTTPSVTLVPQVITRSGRNFRSSSTMPGSFDGSSAASNTIISASIALSATKSFTPRQTSSQPIQTTMAMVFLAASAGEANKPAESTNASKAPVMPLMTFLLIDFFATV
jgi:hypothetical protein